MFRAVYAAALSSCPPLNPLSASAQAMYAVTRQLVGLAVDDALLYAALAEPATCRRPSACRAATAGCAGSARGRRVDPGHVGELHQPRTRWNLVRRSVAEPGEAAAIDFIGHGGADSRC